MDQAEGNTLARPNTPGSGAVTQPGWPGGSVGQGRVNEVDWERGKYPCNIIAVDGICAAGS